MKKIILTLLSINIISCVAGPPTLTPAQWEKLENIKVYKKGEVPSEKYTKLNEISAADCSGAPAGGRVWGNAENAVKTLKMKAVAQNADAVINTDCGSIPFVNNCWAAQKCDGIAVKWKK